MTPIAVFYRKVNAALVQGIETARAVLETTPQGQAANALVVKWLMENQKAAGVFSTVSTMVDRVVDNPAAKIAAQEIAERVHLAAQARAPPPCLPRPCLSKLWFDPLLPDFTGNVVCRFC